MHTRQLSRKKTSVVGWSTIVMVVNMTVMACRELPSDSARCESLIPIGDPLSTPDIDSIVAASWARDSAIFVLDGQADIWLVPINSNGVQRVLRRGSGPKEIPSPRTVLTASKQGVVVADWSGAVVTLDSMGRMLDRFALAKPEKQAAVERRLLWIAADIQGRLYGYVPMERATAATTNLWRCDPQLTGCVIVLSAPQAMLVGASARPRADKAGIAVGIPKNSGQFVVRYDGHVAVVAAESLGVYVTTGSKALSRTVTLPRVDLPLADSDWESLVALDSVRAERAIKQGMEVAMASGAKLSAIPLGMRRVVRVADRPTQFPQIHESPAFQNTDGTIWIARGHAPGGAHRVEVFDLSRRTSCVIVPRGSRLVAVRREFVMAAIRDDDGVERLRRYVRR